MKAPIRKIGNSLGVAIPKRILAQLGMKLGDNVDITAKGGSLIIARSNHDPRAGWAEDSKRIAEAGDGGLVWPEFGNKGDKDLKW